jgi:WD40 repeat protein
VTLREARTGKEIRKISFDDRKQLFRLHHVLPDGKTLAIWAGDRWQTWDLDTGKRRGEILLEETHFVSSPDGKTLATLTAGHLVLWDRDPLKERFPLVRHKGLLDGSSLRYAPDGKTILTAGRDRTIRIWDRQGHEKKVLAVADLNMQAMTISRDGQFLAVLGAPIERAEKAPRTILRVWEGPAERAIFETPIELSTYRSILGPVFGPRGMVVVAKTSYPMMPGLSKLLKPPPDGTSTALLHDTRSKNEPRQIPLGILSINDLAISPDGELLVWASDAGTVGIVNLATGKELRRLTVPARSEKERTGPVEIAFSVDSKRMAISRGEKGIVLVDPVRKGEVQTLAGPGKCPPITIRFMPDGRLLAAGQTSIETTSGTAADISVWDVVTGKLVRPPWRTEEAIELKLSPDGAELAVAHASAVVELWPLTDEKR